LSGWAAGEAQKDPRIQFRGRVPNDEVLRAEAEADLLVNPRPTGDEYTRFSFPSKNLEYMASGTPLLTTRLAGIPDDHFPHLYIIDDDSVEGIRSALREVLGRSPAERARKAAAAREYALKEKSNVRAAGRLIAFLETMVGRRRKLLFIAPLPPPAFGQSIAASRLLAALGGTEECAVVDYNRRRIGSSVVGFSRVRDALRYVLRVKRMARRASTTYLTLSQSVAGNLRDLVTMALCGRTRLIVHLHGGSLRRAIFDRWSVLRALNRLAYRRVDTVIVLGRSLRHIFDGMVESRRIEVVANFASEAAFAAEEEIEAKFIGGPIRMVFLSNMIHGKGYGEAASALVSLAGEIDFQAEFIGQFESRDAHRRFMELIDPHPSIRYLGALGEERFERLRRSHLFLLPSYYVHEGQPISILEAYAAGNFVITTEQGGIRDIFRHEVNGFLVEQRSVRDIADKIRQYSRLCREERLAYARRNRSYALAAFREEVHLTALIAILRGKARTRRESEAIPSDFL
jgi:glycosyltransferase involved in cell wall biosynthesis